MVSSKGMILYIQCPPARAGPEGFDGKHFTLEFCSWETVTKMGGILRDPPASSANRKLLDMVVHVFRYTDSRHTCGKKPSSFYQKENDPVVSMGSSIM